MSHPITTPFAQEDPDAQQSPQDDADYTPRNPQEVAYVLAELDAVPRDELPDGGAREALAAAIRHGAVDGVYRPFGADYHNITLHFVEPWTEPRRRIAEWVDAWNIAHKWHSVCLALWTRDEKPEGGQKGASDA